MAKQLKLKESAFKRLTNLAEEKGVSLTEMLDAILNQGSA